MAACPGEWELLVTSIVCRQDKGCMSGTIGTGTVHACAAMGEVQPDVLLDVTMIK